MKEQNAEGKGPGPMPTQNKSSQEIRKEERAPQTYPASGKRPSEGQQAQAPGDKSKRQS